MEASSNTPLQDNRYLVLGALGRGGMAQVYNAFDRVEQEMVALKVQEDDERAGPAHPLSAEFDHWTRLKHPNIVRVRELAVANSGPFRRGAPYLVMEHVQGRPVHEALAPGGIEPRTVEDIAVQLLRGLRHIHGAGLVHRDLKPANILLRYNGSGGREVKLTDFGLATRSGLNEEPGKISGSLPYVSPEAILGLPVDGRADLYGLGIALYYLAAGSLPSQGETAEELLRWHLGGLPADPRRVRPRFPARLARFIRRLTARDPGKRFADAAEALAVLGASARDEDEPLTAADRGERARLRLALDATRLGAARLFSMPGSPRKAEALLREVQVWSQVHGLGFHRLRSSSERGLLRLVMLLLLGHGSEVDVPVRKYSLHRWLPLAIVSGCPVFDHTRSGGTPTNGAARDIQRFILECSAQKPLALRIDGRPEHDTLLESVVEELRGALPSSGGLLLLLDE